MVLWEQLLVTGAVLFICLSTVFDFVGYPHELTERKKAEWLDNHPISAGFMIGYCLCMFGCLVASFIVGVWL